MAGDKVKPRITRSVVEGRRAFVSRFDVRGYSIRMIIQAMERQREANGEPGAETNPRTDGVWSRQTVMEDVHWLHAEWRKEFLKDQSEHKARVLAELQEVKRQAWMDRKLQFVLSAIQQETRLLGLDEPIKVDIREVAKRNCLAFGLDDATTAEVLAEVENILRGN